MRNKFIYSRHHAKRSAIEALEDYYATGEVFESEVAGIEKVGSFWCVMLWEMY